MATCFQECTTSTEVDELLASLSQDVEDAVDYGDLEKADAEAEVEHLTQLAQERMLTILESPLDSDIAEHDDL